MRAYIYRADVYCEGCASAIMQDTQSVTAAMIAGDASAFEDSDSYPQGPYDDGGGEADSPQHCAACGTFLQNPLTADGRAYVLEAIDEHLSDGGGASNILRTWAEFYDVVFVTALWATPGCLPETDPVVFAAYDVWDAESRAREYLADEIEAAIDDLEDADDLQHVADGVRNGEFERAEIGGYVYQMVRTPASDVLA